MNFFLKIKKEKFSDFSLENYSSEMIYFFFLSSKTASLCFFIINKILCGFGIK
jgi:hypothetical protein